MKFIIVGLHGSGKLAALNECEDLGCKVGREFSNLPTAYEKINIDPQYDVYSGEDITSIFETNAYLCLNGIEETGVIDGYSYYRGISQYTFDNSDVIMMTPIQVESLNLPNNYDHIVWVWLDNKRDSRIRRHAEENRKYDFVEQEMIESHHTQSFVKTIYNIKNSSVLYFSEELPERVATIITAINKHPELLEIFEKNYN